MIPNLHNAILDCNQNITVIRGDVAYDANEQVVDYDLAEAEAKLVELQADYEVKQKAQESAKTSALSKLSALGLTDAEIKALIG